MSKLPGHACDSDDARYRWGALALVVGTAMMRVLYLAYLCPLDLATDEAHYWDWSRQLDWCYYSKGPLVAWLIRLSCACFGDTMLAVRLPAVLCGSLLLLGLYQLTRHVHGSTKLACAMVALAMTLPVVAVGSLLMTIDAPFICAWMWALVFSHRALATDALTLDPAPSGKGETWAWLAAGVCIMLGVLAKHTMVLFLPSFALFLWMTPALRHHFKRRGFWIMAGIGVLGAVPIVAWNVRTDWVTFRHTQGHAGFDDEVFIHWLGPLQYLGGQFAVLLGFWFVAWVRVMWTHRPTVEAKPGFRFLWWMSAPTFVFFAMFAWKNGGGGPNWPAVGYLSGMVLVAGWLARMLRDPRVWPRRFAQTGLASVTTLGLLVTVLLHQPTQIQPMLMRIMPQSSNVADGKSFRIDPTLRLRGWRHLAVAIDHLRVELASRGIEPILASERWTQTGELTFYCQGHPRVYTLGILFGDRASQCDLVRPNPVADPSVFHGQTFIVVNMDADMVRDLFDFVEPTRVVEYREEGCLIASWPVTVGHGFRGRAPITKITSH